MAGSDPADRSSNLLGAISVVVMHIFLQSFFRNQQIKAAERARKERFDRFFRELQSTATSRVLDIGAGHDFIERYPFQERVILLNRKQWGDDPKKPLGFTPLVLVADGCCLPFKDQSMDIVYSNATIEHIGKQNWGRFAAEVRRVGRSYWVSTPNLWFPLDLHYHIPFFHFLPKVIQRRLAAWFGLDTHRYEEEFLDTDLLTAADMRRLFPDATLVKQGALIPYNLTCYKKP